MVIGQASEEAGPTISLGLEEPRRIPYTNTLKPSQPHYKPTPLKQIAYLHGESRIVWEEGEVERTIINDDLQFAVIGKLLYGWPEIQDLRRLIPKKYELKREVNINLFNNRLLIRATRSDDYVHLLSKPQFYVTHYYWSYPMRTIK